MTGICKKAIAQDAPGIIRQKKSYGDLSQSCQQTGSGCDRTGRLVRFEHGILSCLSTFFRTAPLHTPILSFSLHLGKFGWVRAAALAMRTNSQRTLGQLSRDSIDIYRVGSPTAAQRYLSALDNRLSGSLRTQSKSLLCIRPLETPDPRPTTSTPSRLVRENSSGATTSARASPLSPGRLWRCCLGGPSCKGSRLWGGAWRPWGRLRCLRLRSLCSPAWQQPQRRPRGRRVAAWRMASTWHAISGAGRWAFLVPCRAARIASRAASASAPRAT